MISGILMVAFFLLLFGVLIGGLVFGVWIVAAIIGGIASLIEWIGDKRDEYTSSDAYRAKQRKREAHKRMVAREKAREARLSKAA